MTTSSTPPSSLPASSAQTPAGGGEGVPEAVTVPDVAGSDVIGRARAAVAAVDLVVNDARSSIAGWDNLAWVNAFAAAAERARDVLRTSTHPVERRLVGARLLRLMPVALLPEEQLQRHMNLSLPDPVMARADNDFALNRGDVPRVHPSWTAFLTNPGVLHEVLRPGRHEWLLAPRSFSPRDANASAMLVRVAGTSGAGSSTELAQLEIKNPGGHTSRRRRTSDGKDAGPAELRPEVLLSWLRHGGPGARGLDLRRADDRCLLLTFHETMRERRLDVLLARPAGDDGERRAAVISAVVDAAVDAVSFAALDPMACRFVFPGDERHQSWVQPAIARLTGLGLGAEIMPLTAAGPTREFVWLDAVVDGGFVGGAMSDVAQARAFSRLAVSVLAPLGALPMSGSRCGRGVVLTLIDDDAKGPRQRGPLWVEPAATTTVMPLADAWARGHGRLLPLPHADTAHDVTAMPAFLQAFADAIAGPDDDDDGDESSDDGVDAVMLTVDDIVEVDPATAATLPPTETP